MYRSKAEAIPSNWPNLLALLNSRNGDFMNVSGFEKIDAMLSESEVNDIGRLIIDRIYSLTGQKIESVEKYHTLPDSVHELLLSKKDSRVFPHKSVQKILSMPSFLKLQDYFAGFAISDVVTEDHELNRKEIYFRLVRPHRLSDIGCPHCDFWFHKAYDLKYGGPGTTWKCWIPITVEPRKSGLEFFPHALLNEVRYSADNKRLSCDKGQAALGKPLLVPVQPGDALFFRDDVIHSGAVNEGSDTRSSIEITFIQK